MIIAIAILQAQIRQQQMQKLALLQKQHSDLLKELQMQGSDGYSEFDTLYSQPMPSFAHDLKGSNSSRQIMTQVW